MQLSVEKFGGEEIRYLKLDNGGVLLNSKDLCSILSITDRSTTPELLPPCINLTHAIQHAARINIDFALWIRDTFMGCYSDSPVTSIPNNEWKVG